MSDRPISPERLIAAAEAVLRDDTDALFKFSSDELEQACTFLKRMGMRDEPPPKVKATKL